MNYDFNPLIAVSLFAILILVITIVLEWTDDEKVPNETTLATFEKTDRGEELTGGFGSGPINLGIVEEHYPGKPKKSKKKRKPKKKQEYVLIAQPSKPDWEKLFGIKSKKKRKPKKK